MKHLLVFILAVAGGMFGAVLLEKAPELSFGATTARTTITNPWTFSATTTTANITATTADTATSTLQVGCIQATATSTATPIRLVIGSTLMATTSYDGVNANGFIAWRYGKCPKI